MSIEIQKPKIEYITRWESAERRLKEVQRELTSAECELSNSVNALGKVLCPENCKIGEEFSIWTDSKLVTVKKIGNSDYEVSWRKYG